MWLETDYNTYRTSGSSDVCDFRTGGEHWYASQSDSSFHCRYAINNAVVAPSVDMASSGDA